MLRNVFTKTLWEMRRALLGWTIGITTVGIFYAAFYPAIRTPEYEEMMETFAPELMEALGFAAITTPAGYLGSTTFGLLGPILVIVFATGFGTRAIAGDEDSGKLDLLLAHPVSRWEIVAQRFGALIVASVGISLVLFVGLVAVSGAGRVQRDRRRQPVGRIDAPRGARDPLRRACVGRRCSDGQPCDRHSGSRDRRGLGLLREHPGRADPGDRRAWQRLAVPPLLRRTAAG